MTSDSPEFNKLSLLHRENNKPFYCTTRQKLVIHTVLAGVRTHALHRHVASSPSAPAHSATSAGHLTGHQGCQLLCNRGAGDGSDFAHESGEGEASSAPSPGAPASSDSPACTGHFLALSVMTRGYKERGVCLLLNQRLNTKYIVLPGPLFISC